MNRERIEIIRRLAETDKARYADTYINVGTSPATPETAYRMALWYASAHLVILCEALLAEDARSV